MVTDVIGTVARMDAPAAEAWDWRARDAVFAEDPSAARERIREEAARDGVYPASIQGLYTAFGRGEVSGFTVPAINIRGLTYDVARAIFRAAIALDAGPVIFEIARTEIAYTEQRPAEYSAMVLAAAVREGWRGPVFVQGDHFQTNPKNFAASPEKEKGAIKSLIEEALAAGFFNIDIDSSTLVDLSRPTVLEQQRLNFEVCAELTRFIRDRQPAGVTVSVGGEIGEVGHKNSTPEELEAFMTGYLEAMAGGAGISKISVQTGTSHGGVPLPDGTVAAVNLDFDTLAALSSMARGRYGMGGAVQHGASTLPMELFDRFPAVGTVEIHLATEFQNMIYDGIPAELRDRVYSYLADKCAGERKAGDTDEQFFYKTRKKGFGPFKREFWGLPATACDGIMAGIEARVGELFRKLGLAGTRETLRYI